MRCSVLLGLLVLAWVTSACKRTESRRSTPEEQHAIHDSAAPAPSDDGTLRLVATRRGYTADALNETSVDAQGTLRVVAGGIVFEARDGTLVPVAPMAAYAATMPADTVPLMGLEGNDTPVLSAVNDPDGGLRVFDGNRSFAVRPDGLAAPRKERTGDLPIAPFRGGLLTMQWRSNGYQLFWNGSPATRTMRAKSDRRGTQRYDAFTILRDGTLVALGSEPPSVTIWRPDAAFDAGEIATLDAPDASSLLCALASAFDGHAYVCCRQFPDEGGQLHRVDGGRFERLFASVEVRCRTTPSIDREGALYHVIDSPDGDRVERCPRAGECEPLRVELPDATLRVPHYWLGFDQIRDEHGSRWLSLAIDASKPEGKISVASIYARDRFDVWLFAPEAVFHTGVPAAARVDLPTRTDARVLVRNDRPPEKWTGHCDHVFVSLGTAADASRVLLRKGRIVEALGGPYAPPAAWRAVTGRLYDRDVVGVVAWRGEPQWSREAMEGAIEKLVASFTDDPMATPDVHCTLPVLTSVLDAP